MKLPIHVAMAIFCPDRDDGGAYLLDLARTRMRLFAGQKWVDSCTIVTVVHQMDDATRGILHSLRGRGSELKKIDHVDVVVLKDLDSPRGGITQLFAETDAEWIYYSDDGHVLPLRQNSVFRFIEEAVHHCRDCDAIVESDLQPRPAQQFNQHRFAKQYGVRWNGDWYKNEEYGFALKSELRGRGHYAPPGSCRNVHGMMLSGQGLNVASNPRHGELFLHHGLHVGPNAIKFKDAQRLLPRRYPKAETIAGLRKRIADELAAIETRAVVEDRWSI